MNTSMTDEEFQNRVTAFTLDEGHQEIWRSKTNNYNKAKSILLDYLKDPPQNENDFLKKYSQIVDPIDSKETGLWTSGWLFRNKTKISKKYKSFTKLLQLIVASKPGDIKLFEPALNLAKKIPGLGLNVLTELLMTFYPKTFPVLNGNSLISIKHLGFAMTLSKMKSLIKPYQYEQFQEFLFVNICKKGNFSNFMHCDCFLSFLYWSEAKEAAGIRIASKEDGENKGETRQIPIGLRYRILVRDNFTCQKCGRSPNANPGIVLHIDHIQPFSKGGRTSIENLQVLCSECNIGKSDHEY